MSQSQRRTKVRNSAILSAKSSTFNHEQSIPIPSRQGDLNEYTDFTVDPSLMFDELPQPFRRINKVFESILDDAWTLIEQREQQRILDQSKFVSEQHTSSTLINAPYPVSLIGSHSSGTLAFFNGIDHQQSYLICYDSQIDEILNQIPIEYSLKQILVFKFETIYFLSVIDQFDYWRMFAYKNQKYYLLFTQYEAEDDSKRPLCLMTQTGLNDDYLIVSWFGGNDSWFEIYKLTKDQWKSEITAQEQSTTTNETDIVEDAIEPSAEITSGLIRGQFTRLNLLFKSRAPKFSAGSNNFQQLMKNTENQSNIGQGISNHFYTQQIIDMKTILIRDLILSETPDRTFLVPKNEPLPSMIPNFAFIPTGLTTTGGTHSIAISWPTTNQLLIFKMTKSEAKGKDAFETRPISIWPFSTRITSLTYDFKHEHLAIGLLSGNVCIIERTSTINDLPSIQHLSSYPIVDIHAIDSIENSLNIEMKNKQNGFLVLSTDGKIYRIKFRSILSEEKNTDQQQQQQQIIPCFPHEQSKDSSKILRMIFFNCNPSNLFLTINERNRIYINDAFKSKQLCEIVIPELTQENPIPFQIALIDNARSIILGVPKSNEYCFLRFYRVPLEHFPSLETYYPKRISSTIEEIETSTEIKPIKSIASQTKKGVITPEIDKSSLLFDEKIKDLFRQRQINVNDRQERLRARWSELKLHFNPVHEQTT